MKLRELISRVKKDPLYLHKVDIYDDFCLNFHIEFYGWIEQERLTSYWIGNWYCTDTDVGYKVYYFDDNPVAVSSQNCRKGKDRFEWITQGDYFKVKEYVQSLVDEKTKPESIPLADLDEEMGEGYKISFNSQLFDYHKDIAMLNGEPVTIIEVIKTDKYGIDKEVIVQTKDGTKKFIKDIETLDFKYNIGPAYC